nr:GlsB/YeaQ/YmgE family stress response membrane protein [uncultured Sphingomonas sp.]
MLETYGFFGWLLIGLLAGALAKFIMPGRDPGGCLVTILLGIAGALLMGFIGNALGWYSQGQAGGFIAATFGALLILTVYRFTMRRRS